MGIPFVIFLVLPKSGSPKTAQHPTARSFALDVCADDEGLLAQAEEDKEKCKQKSRCGAVGVRFPSAYSITQDGNFYTLPSSLIGIREGEGEFYLR